MVIAQCAVWIYFSDNAYLPPNRDAPRTEMLYWAFLYGVMVEAADEGVRLGLFSVAKDGPSEA